MNDHGAHLDDESENANACQLAPGAISLHSVEQSARCTAGHFASWVLMERASSMLWKWDVTIF